MKILLTSWDRILLILALLALAGTAVFMSLDVVSTTNDMTAQTVKHVTSKPLPPLNADSIAQKQAVWNAPLPWEPKEDHALFVGRKYYFFPDKNSFALAQGELKIFGLPLSYIEQYHLDYKDPLVAFRDPDGDGFTNMDEFNSATNPQDPNSHPTYLKLLRLKTYTAKRYRLKFQSKSDLDGQELFQLATADGTKKVQFLKKEESVDGFKVMEYRVKTKNPEPPDYVSDVSELDLFNEKTQEKVTLVIGKEMDNPTVSASFILLTPELVDHPVEAKVGGFFTITKNLPNNLPPVVKKFKLLSAQPTSAVIVDQEDNKEYTVNLFQPSDLDQMVKPQ